MSDFHPVGAPRVGWLDALVLVVIVGISAALALRCARAMSHTIDEHGQMFIGERVLLPGGFEGLTAWGTAPLPVLATATLPAALAKRGDVPAPDDLGLLFRRRMFNLWLFGVPLLVVLFLVLREQSGFVAATSATALLAFSPMFLAHAVIAATDVCAAFFILLALLAVTHYAQAPSWRHALFAGGLIGIAMAAKQTAVILFGVMAVGLWLTRTRADETQTSPRPEPWRTLALRLAAMAGLAMFVTWSFYGFHLTTLAGDGPWRPQFSDSSSTPAAKLAAHIGREWLLPASWVSFAVQVVHNDRGHPTFFLGQVQQFGTWKYWPMVAGLKGTLPELLLAPVLLARVGGTKFWRDARILLPLLTLGLLVLGCVTSNLNIGLRYLLPAAPIALLALFGMLDAAPRWYRRTVLMGAPVLAIAQLGVAIAASPHQLSYFNGLFVPRERVHHVTTDANLDWGQGLPSLKEAIARHRMQRVTLCTWRHLRPEAYGLDCLSWWTSPAEQIAASDWIAISARMLHDPRCALGRALTPVAPDDFGELSLMLYATKRPEVRRALELALAAPRS